MGPKGRTVVDALLSWLSMVITNPVLSACSHRAPGAAREARPARRTR